MPASCGVADNGIYARAWCCCCCCHHPTRDKSTSHSHHCRQVSLEEASTTALLKEQTRIKTMGFPRKVSVKGFARPLSSTASTAAVEGAGSAAAATAAGRIGGRGVQSAACGRRPAAAAAGSASALVDTQKSRVPLKWAASSLVPPCSTYNAQHGAHPGRSPQVGMVVGSAVGS